MFSINYITNIRHKKKTIETIVLALNRIEKTEKKNTNVTPSVKNIVQYYSVTDKKKKNQPPNFIQSQSEPSKEVTISQSWF